MILTLTLSINSNNNLNNNSFHSVIIHPTLSKILLMIHSINILVLLINSKLKEINVTHINKITSIINILINSNLILTESIITISRSHLKFIKINTIKKDILNISLDKILNPIKKVIKT